MRKVVITDGTFSVCWLIFILVLCVACGGGSSGGENNSPQDVEKESGNNKNPTLDVIKTVNTIEKERVTISCTATDPDGKVVSYLWEQISGKEIELNGSDKPKISFIAPEVSQDDTIVLRLTITDNSKGTASAEITINIADAPDNEVDAKKDSLIVFNTTHGIYSTSVDGKGITWLTEQFPDAGVLPYQLSPNNKFVAGIFGKTSPETPDSGAKVFIATIEKGSSEIIKEFPEQYHILEISWSKNSEFLLYKAFNNQDDVSQNKEEIRTLSQNGKGDTLIREFMSAEYTNYGLKWSPDGMHLSYDLDSRNKKTTELFIVSADGGGEAPIVGGASEDYLLFSQLWSDDGSRLAFMSTDKASRAIRLHTVMHDGSDRIQVADDISYPDADLMTWSPDANFLAFNSFIPSERRKALRIVASDGTNELRYPEDPYYQWSSNNKLITVDKSSKEFIVVDPQSSNELKIPMKVTSDDQYGSFKLSPNGKFIAYTVFVKLDEPIGNYNDCVELHIVGTDGTTHTQITSQNELIGVNITYEWAPDSKRLAFEHVDDIMSPSNLYTVQPDGSNRVTVVKGEQNVALEAYQWTPDGHAIVYLLKYPPDQPYQRSPAHLFSVMADGGQPAIKITASMQEKIYITSFVVK